MNDEENTFNAYRMESAQYSPTKVKWEKGLYKKASVRYLKTKYKEKPRLFTH